MKPFEPPGSTTDTGSDKKCEKHWFLANTRSCVFSLLTMHAILDASSFYCTFYASFMQPSRFVACLEILAVVIMA